ncbi:hypothetical protein AVEN_83876-1 [Araneus ventricosus]|uniref:Uncharacterized protein n=1 Tax=Araneus ventricosus TaxID=182803 RepID=A0A4Y2FWH3_ARAVE|nr:hypothetical protein AVEN_83876-1 [Araneus ventricosus]
MENEPPQEVVVLQISSPLSSKRPVLRKDDRELCEARLIDNLLQDLTPKKGSQMPTNGDVLRYFVFLNRGLMHKDKIEDPDFVFPSTSSGATWSKRLRSKIPSPSIALKLPRNPFTSKITSNMGDRLNIPAGQRTAFMGAILKEGGVPIEKATLLIKSTWTAGKEVRKSSAQAIKATFTAPKFATLHWDGKLVPVFIKGNKERVAILVSGMPDVVEGKVLGIPVIANTTGEEQARTTFSLANDWKISDNVRSLVLNTIVSNSGWKTGACVRIENLFDKNLLLLACRHHIFERILSSVHK